MNLRWASHLREEAEKKSFQEQVRMAAPVLRRLRDILQEDFEATQKRNFSEKDFEATDWSHKQAYRNGDLARLLQTLQLLTHVKG